MRQTKARTAEATSLRVLVTGDHSVIREGLVLLLRDFDGLDVFSQASQDASAKGVEFDVVLYVLEPDHDIAAALAALIQERPTTNVLCMLLSHDEADALEVLRGGALGVIDETFQPESLIDALKQVAAGEIVISNQLARRLARRLTLPDKVPAADWELTPREIEVLYLLADGYTNKDMAEKLSLSEHTIRAHLRGIMQKLHVSNRVQAAALAWQLRLNESGRGLRRSN
jgi:DNA-binding NarL/FixJ family response regulator